MNNIRYVNLHKAIDWQHLTKDYHFDFSIFTDLGRYELKSDRIVLSYRSGDVTIMTRYLSQTEINEIMDLLLLVAIGGTSRTTQVSGLFTKYQHIWKNAAKQYSAFSRPFKW